MVRKPPITITSIRELSYPDFIGFINQWNTPPGAYSTISKLAIFSKMNKKSHILEIACSTGFSSGELALQSGCEGIGIDLSKNSIKMANYNKKYYRPNIKISYKIANGYSFSPQKKFTHIMVGGGLKFFNDPEKMFARCLEMLNNDGYILATPYYEISKMPTRLANNLHNTLGIPLTAFAGFSYKEMMKLYDKLEIIYEDRNELAQETEKELEHYCKSIVKRACKIQNINDSKIYDVMYSRLLKIRRLINDTRPYQEYCVLVLRYRKSVYPNRYVALF